MKTFVMTHNCSDAASSLTREFTENDPPEWLLHKENNWWFKRHLLTLRVGGKISSDWWDFQRIK